MEGADARVDVWLVDYAFALSRASVPAGGLVAFDIVNTGRYPHEFAVVQPPEGVTLAQVLEEPVLEEQVAFFDVNFAGPGGNASFELENLEVGTYTVVCFIEEPPCVPTSSAAWSPSSPSARSRPQSRSGVRGGWGGRPAMTARRPPRTRGIATRDGADPRWPSLASGTTERSPGGEPRFGSSPGAEGEQ